jgi:hypothetical protein
MIAPQIHDQLQDNTTAIVHRLDDLDSPFWRLNSRILPLPSASAFWSNELAVVERARKFTQLAESTKKTKSLEVGWDGYRAPVPNDVAVATTLVVLFKVLNSQLTPYSVLPSADGGVGISFRGRDNKRAVLELLNDGTSSYMLYGKGHPTERSEFDSNTDLPRILQRLEGYL